MPHLSVHRQTIWTAGDHVRTSIAAADLPAIRAALIDRTEQVATALLGEPNRRLSTKRELRFGRKGSVAIVVEGAKRGQWFDHAENVGGDLLALITTVRGCSFRDAMVFAADFVGLNVFLRTLGRAAREVPRLTHVEVQKRNQRFALDLWEQASGVAGTPVMPYLASRRLELPEGLDGRVLRFHPNCPFGPGTRHPCMLALMRDVATDEPLGIHRTALSAAGAKIGRRTLGPKSGAAIKLSADEEVAQGLCIGEGIETTLAGMALGFRPAWAVGDAGNLGAFPVLAGVQGLTILVDNDLSGTGQRHALDCSASWTGAGRDVFRVIPDRTGDDLNDVVCGG